MNSHHKDTHLPFLNPVAIWAISIVITLSALGLGQILHGATLFKLALGLAVLNAAMVITWSMGLDREPKLLRIALIFGVVILVFLFLGTYPDLFISSDLRHS